jgi:hypothetical protein
VKTPDGEALVVLEIDQPGAEVRVDGERITVSVPGDDKPVEIRAAPGRHQLQISKDGFVAFTREIELRSRKSESIKVRLEPLSVAAARPKEQGFVPLFNGKDLTGWLVDGGDAKAWAATDGEIIAWGEDYRSRNYLLTDREYVDFRLRLEFNLSRGSAAGIALRALRGEKLPYNGKPIFEHPLFKLVESRGREETGTTRWVLNTTGVAPGQSAEMQPAGSWNRLEIELRDRTIRAWVNDKQVVSATLAAGARLEDGCIPALNRPRGRIGLQKHTGTVRFRNIEIKELPVAAAAAAADGPERSQGFAAVIGEAHRGKWRIADGCLEQTTRSEHVSILFGDRSWSNYDYSLEFLRVEGDCWMLFLVDPEKAGCLFGLSAFHNSAHDLVGWAPPGKPWRTFAKKDGSVPSGTWQRARVSVRGSHAQCFLNGQKVLDCQIDTHSTGAVGLRTWGGRYRFRNIKVTDPQGKVLLEGPPELDSSWAAK